MVVAAYVFETRGGAILAEFEPEKCSWSWSGNEPETVTPIINLADVNEQNRGWGNLASEWNHSIAVDVGGGRYLGGPIMPHDFDDDAGTLTVTARGIRRMLADRNVLPVSALTTSLVDPNTSAPRGSQDTIIANYDYGTIGKKIVQQACAWPSWTDIPISYHADRIGKRVKLYSAVDLIPVDEALTELSSLENGPDIRFELNKVGDAFEWRYLSGTEQDPRLSTGSSFAWELGRASKLKVRKDPTRMGSVAWSVGGRSADKLLVEMQYDPTLPQLGGILLERTTGMNANESDILEARRWNAEELRTAARPWEFWTFSVPADESPYPAEYSPGDLVEITVTEATKVSGRYVAPGQYTRRIASLSSQGDDSRIAITCGENYG
jgi:hypothetical protein